MQFQNFTKRVVEYFEEELGEEYNIDLINVDKNNSTGYLRLRILKNNENIAPCIYLAQYFQMLSEKNDLEEVLEMIMSNYVNAVQIKADMQFFQDFEKIRGRIFSKIINTEKNKELLNQIPHVDYLDWSIVYYMKVPEEIVPGTILIRNNHLVMWGIESSELINTAKLNNEKFLPVEINGMGSVIKGLLLNDEPECEELDLESEQMLVATNKSRMFGANSILYEGVLEGISKRKGLDIFVLPSSVHEAILILDDGTLIPEDLKNMVVDVNQNIVDKEEVLSDHVYKYSRESKKLTIVA